MCHYFWTHFLFLQVLTANNTKSHMAHHLTSQQLNKVSLEKVVWKRTRNIKSSCCLKTRIKTSKKCKNHLWTCLSFGNHNQLHRDLTTSTKTVHREFPLLIVFKNAPKQTLHSSAYRKDPILLPCRWSPHILILSGRLPEMVNSLSQHPDTTTCWINNMMISYKAKNTYDMRRTLLVRRGTCSIWSGSTDTQDHTQAWMNSSVAFLHVQICKRQMTPEIKLSIWWANNLVSALINIELSNILCCLTLFRVQLEMWERHHL